MEKIGNVEPKCPYCGFNLDKKPTQKKKCPNCGKNMFVRTRPDDRERVLVTEEQVLVIEAQWAKLSEQRLLEYEQREREKLESNPEYKQEKDKLTKQWGKEPAVNDVLWSLANEHLLQHARNGDWGLYTNAKLDIARILENENKPERALQVYLEICYLDINGPSNTGGVTDATLLKKYPPFDIKDGYFAPAIVESVKNLAGDLGIQNNQIKEMFSKIAETNHINLKLPVPPAKAWDLLHRELERLK